MVPTACGARRLPVPRQPRTWCRRRSRSPLRTRSGPTSPNVTVYAACKPENSSGSAETKPLTVAGGVRNSWLTIARISARHRTTSWRGVISRIVTMRLSNSPFSERIGEPFNSTVTLRPSGTLNAISSARALSPAFINWPIDTSARESLCPSARWPRSAWTAVPAGPGFLLTGRLLYSRFNLVQDY